MSLTTIQVEKPVRKRINDIADTHGLKMPAVAKALVRAWDTMTPEQKAAALFGEPETDCRRTPTAA